MTLKFMTLLALALTMIFGHALWAAEPTADVDPGQEELLRDSEAARNVAREKKEQLLKERELVARLKAHNAQLKKQAKAQRLKTETELRTMDREYRSLKREEAALQNSLEQHNRDMLYFEHSLKVAQEKLDAQRDRGVTLVGLKNQKLQRIETLTRQKSSLLAELQQRQKILNLASADFEESRRQEKAAAQDLQAHQASTAQAKLASEAKVASLKAELKRNQAKILETRDQIEALNLATARLAEQVKVGTVEVERSSASLNQTQQQLASVQSQVPPLKLRRDCKIHSDPSRESRVLGVQPGGTSVAWTKQQDGWVGISSTTIQGQVGFVAKACF